MSSHARLRLQRLFVIEEDVVVRGLDAARERAEVDLQLGHPERAAQRILQRSSAQDQFAVGVDAHVCELVVDTDLLTRIVFPRGLDDAGRDAAGAKHGADAVISVRLGGVVIPAHDRFLCNISNWRTVVRRLRQR
ncbi:hypothetical protein CBM2633_P270009 [Cupriavidus taiwanensis]|uniref:Uncharacterized protein n=2 Tax=Cupriavidus TaxID=106589 RepID=A0A375HXM4_9BURK|nr:hypothetical protein CBM2588_P300008 [Cupriavidus taiwanensis]SOZ40555.1 hypothetical protein CBM2605_P270010 [Cupriavidus neocaledonicus]SOY77859.1 hypothetical protein CBM2586_P280010 [Cupriavidus taiwanensis]SOZ16427.1 hypothetical protein CBM2597_P230009 [Cupriavidus taiwanensis]SOZ20241.1 hypothetical protein CBM2595_P270010 [Cupriavidus taiwanensis]